MYTFHSVNYNLLRGGFIKYKGGGGGYYLKRMGGGGGGFKKYNSKIDFLNRKKDYRNICKLSFLLESTFFINL